MKLSPLFCKLEEICPFVLGVGATHSSSDEMRTWQEVKEFFLPKVAPRGLCSCFRERGQAAHVLLTAVGRTSLFFWRLKKLCPHFLKIISFL